MENLNLSHRSFIWKLALAAVAASVVEINAYSNSAYTLSVGKTSAGTSTIRAFPKIFDKLGKEMFPFLAGIGFEGIDLTVCSGGHVLPENVEKDLLNSIGMKELHFPYLSFLSFRYWIKQTRHFR
jgi:hypothetical protein